MATVDFDELRIKWEEDNIESHNEAMRGILSLAGLSSQEAYSFLKLNENFLRKELVTYGFSLDNPFIIFLSLFLKSGLNAEIFCKTEGNWGIVHNLVANNILTTRQLTFKTAKEEDKPMLLLNANFWGDKIPLGDRTWVMQFWIWLGSKETNNEIINTACRLILASSKKDISKNMFEQPSNITEENYVSVYNALNKEYIALVDKAAQADLTEPSIITKMRKYFMSIFRAVSDIESLNNNLDVLAKTLTKIPKNANQNEVLRVNNLNIELVKNKLKAFNDLIYTVYSANESIDRVDSFVKMKLVSPTQMSTSIAKAGEKTDLSNRDTLSKEYKREEGVGEKEISTNNRQASRNNINKVSDGDYDDAVRRFKATTGIDLSNLNSDSLSASAINRIINDLGSITTYFKNKISR